MPKKAARRKNSWKNTKVNTHKNKQTRLGLLVLLIIVLIMGAGLILDFVQRLDQPLAFKNETEKTYTWEGIANLNIILKGKKVSLLSYDPQNQTVKTADIPDQTYIEVPEGMGSWQVRSIFGVGQTMKKNQGALFLKRSMASFLGLPIDAYIELKGKLADKNAKDIVELLRENPINAPVIYFNIATDLTPKELVKLGLGIFRSRFDKIEDFDLRDLGAFNDSKLADGTEILEPDFLKIDNFSQNFTESKLAAERASVAIFNATSHPGLAKKAERIIGNMGSQVIIASNSDTHQEHTIVLINPDEKDFSKVEYTYKRIIEAFAIGCYNKSPCDRIGCLKELDNSSCQGVTDPGIGSSRAEISLILGEDFYRRF